MEYNILMDLVSDVTRIYTNYVERRLATIGLHNGQASIITALGQHGPCSQKDLASFRQVSPATVSVMLGRMERDALVTRTPSASGGKANIIALTSRGQEVYQKISDTMDGEVVKLLKGLSTEEKDQAAHIFQVIAENLRNA